MFVKPPEGFEDCFGFVFDDQYYHWSMANNNWNERPKSSSYDYMGAIVVSNKIKVKVEQLFGEIFKLKKVELPLNTKFSQVIEDVVSGMHHGHVKQNTTVSQKDLAQNPIDLYNLDENDKCAEFCRCKFGKDDRIWAHNIYHLLIKRCAKEIGISYDILVSDYTEYKNITVSKVSQYLSVNDWDIKEGISDDEGAVGFILVSFLRNFREYFRLAHIQDLGEERLIDKNPFEDCGKEKCKYDEKYTIWRSESTIQTYDKLPIRKGMKIPAAWIPDIEKKRKENVPLAAVRQNNCICSTEKYYFGLYVNEDVEGVIKEKCIKDYRHEIDLKKDEKTKENKQISELIAKYYSRFLPKKQAKVASKIIRRYPAVSNNERHSKFLLRNTLKKVVSHWPDIEYLNDQIRKPKNSKRKGGDNDG